MRIPILYWLTTALCLSLLPPVVATAAIPAGHIETLKGRAQATTPQGQVRELRRGAPFYSGERITTERRSAVALRFADRSRFDLGEGADLRVDRFAYRPARGQSGFTTRILKGTFRFLTGLIARARPRAMRVRLPVATIGIRGTHVMGEADATSAKVILLEQPKDDQRPTAVTVSNDYGSVVIDRPGYGTEVPDEHSPPSPVRRMKMRTINNLIRSLQNISRIHIPRVPHAFH